jgi:hypothetical protein
MDFEPAAMMESVTPLAAVFHFSPDDLRVNRERRLSFGQRRRLWLRFFTTVLGGLLLMAAPILIAWVLIVWSTGQNLEDTIFDNRAMVGYLVGLILGLMYGIANAKSLILAFDLLFGRVKMIRGTANIWGSYLSMGPYRFVIEDEAAAFMQSGMRYRAYVLPFSSTLLSIEFAD